MAAAAAVSRPLAYRPCASRARSASSISRRLSAPPAGGLQSARCLPGAAARLPGHAYTGSAAARLAACDLKRETLHIPASEAKSGRGRTVPMHDRVIRLLEGLWHTRGQPDAGTVFLSSRGDPYRDTRSDGAGNPLKSAHDTACNHA